MTTLVIALWLGSLAHTLLTVSSLFRAFPKAESRVAVDAAPVVFAVTEQFHLGLAVAGLIAIALWRAPARIGVALAMAAILAFVQVFGISPRMETLRAAGEGSGPAFARLHGVSSVQYLAQTLCLLVATILLPGAIVRNDRPVK